MDLGGASWGLITVVGTLLLLIVIAWAALKNRTSRRTREESERATRNLYREEDIAHRNDNDMGT